MAGMLQTTPWNVAPWTSPVPYLLQQLQIVPQQLQYVQQAEYVQQQQLQQVLQVLQIVPQQIQQLVQSIQFLPQHVAQVVQQALSQTSGVPSPGITAFGASVPFGGLPIAQPLQSIGFGSSFPSIQPMTSAPFGGGQAGYVM